MTLHRWSPSIGIWGRGLLISIGICLVYSGLVLGYSAHSSSISIPGPFWETVGWYMPLAFGTVGIPVLLWYRYGLRGPLTLLVCILVFWHVLVSFPPFGSGEGDSPAFIFVFFFAPFYLLAYALLASGEYWLRDKIAQ